MNYDCISREMNNHCLLLYHHPIAHYRHHRYRHLYRRRRPQKLSSSGNSTPYTSLKPTSSKYRDFIADQF